MTRFRRVIAPCVGQAFALSDACTVDSVAEQLRDMLQANFVEMFVHGNLLPMHARTLGRQWREALAGSTPLPPDCAPLPSTALLPTSVELGGQLTRLSGVAANAAESNSAIELFMQVGTTLSLQEEAQLLVLAQVASKHAFHVLRTQKQLGYVVQCSVRSVGTSRGLTVLIQSSVQPPAQLEAEIESWMREFRSGTLAELSTSSFAEYQSAVSALLDEHPKTLQQETSQLWSELVEGTYRFQHEAQLARAVRELELAQVRSPLMISD